MQDEVARQVVSKLRLRLDAPGQARLGAIESATQRKKN
jgi:hypothetical protein